MKLSYLILLGVIVAMFSYQSVEAYEIPEWIKNNAKWWANDEIDDGTFIQGIEFLVKEKIIIVSSTTTSSSVEKIQKIPEWVKTNASWWAEDNISDDTFLDGIQFLIENGILVIPDSSNTDDEKIEHHIQNYKNVKDNSVPKKGTYTYFLNELPHAWKSDFEGILDQSIRFWEYNYPEVKIVKARSVHDADFEIQMKQYHEDGRCGYFENESAFIPRIGVSIGYKDESGNSFLLTKYETYEILTHELGHVIGIAHNDNPNSIMYSLGCEYIGNVETGDLCDNCQIAGINIKPEKGHYYTDETIILSGQIPAQIKSKLVSIQVLDTNKHLYKEFSVEPLQGGKVEVSFMAKDAKLFGKYTVVVEYGGIETTSSFVLNQTVK